jgi:hypothetical protein
MRQIFPLMVSIAMIGCKPELPPLEWQAERARVGSDTVDQVCGGTLARIDREIDQIEARLELSRTGTVADIYIVEPEVVAAYCRSDVEGCTQSPGGTVYVTPRAFEHLIAHELTHQRLSLDRDLVNTPRLFREGIAVAMEPSYCPRWFSPELTPNQLLDTRSGSDLLAIPGGYYLGGELVAWLLATHGPADVLTWMIESKRSDQPAQVRREYRERFGSDLDADLFAHLRDPATISPKEFGCLGPQAPTDPSGRRIALQATLDCDADDVQNSFLIDGGGYVEWILTIDEHRAGSYALVGEVPEWTVLTIEACRCRASMGAEPQEALARPLRASEQLGAGSYRLRWFGQLDAGATLDVELIRR